MSWNHPNAAPILGVEISTDFSWNEHMKKVTAKANKASGFERKNLSKCPERVKQQAYTALIRPRMEYAWWDPHLLKHKDQLEMVERRSAWFIKNDYQREEGTFTKILQDLQWKTLEQRRKLIRLLLMYKIVNGLIGISIPEYVTRAWHGTRGYHQLRSHQLSTNCDTLYLQIQFPVQNNM